MSSAERALPLRHAVALGLLQGPTELLPVSSSAHTSLLPWFARWPYQQLDGEIRKAFEVALHSGAALALVLSMRSELSAHARLMRGRGALLLVLASAPPALAGLLFGRTIERRLGGPRSIACALLAGGVAMALADAEAPEGRRDCQQARLRDGLALGLAQATALIPGVSRAGATLTAARSRGFSRRASSALCWDLALPVMAGASALQGLRLLNSGRARPVRRAMLAGLASSFCSTLASAALLRGSLSDIPLLPCALYRCTLAVAVLARSERHG